ncbi:DUF2939 domain-containing protein [Acinetobacter sp. CFCC 10889]|uniref:DUF2939 domain-containing protein n=1 Tax=Acinetobacter sp. CFCC 10889 TaxID=1775557 RepID=UPI001D17FBAD|nr:DUF2939 domain-containing protein [Acinetobacter sp. CFCC 10889]
MLSLVLWLASPYWMLYQIHQAIEQNQAAKISKYIDFPQVQASLEPQIQQKIIQAIGLQNNPTWLGQLGEDMSEKIAHQVAQILLTPESIMLFMQGKQLKETVRLPKLSVNNTVEKILPFEKQASDQFLSVKNTPSLTTVNINQVKTHYISLNTFQVIVPTFSSKETKFIFKRHYIKWKLIGIYFN